MVCAGANQGAKTPPKRDAAPLGREKPDSPWRVVKPLDLATDAAAIKLLIEGLYELQAIRVLDRAAVTLPTRTRSKPFF